MKPLEILIDFDGTVVTHDFPHNGLDVGAEFVLKALTDLGHKLILFTMRCDHPADFDFIEPGNGIVVDESRNHLTHAVNWFKEKDIPLYGIQYNPTQHVWTTSNKAYGQMIIDDIALGAPLCRCPSISDRHFINWIQIVNLLKKRNIFEEGQSFLIQKNIHDFFEKTYNIDINKYATT